MFDDEGNHFGSSSRNHSYKREPPDTEPYKDSRQEEDFDTEVCDKDKSFDPPPPPPSSSTSLPSLHHLPLVPLIELLWLRFLHV